MEMLYTREILRLAASLEGERLTDPDISITKSSRVCGSTLTIDLELKDKQVVAFGAEVKACALGQASTAIAEKHIVGKTWTEIEPIYQDLQKLLAGEAIRFKGEWGDLNVFQAAQNHKARHSAILLVFKALEEGLG